MLDTWGAIISAFFFFNDTATTEIYTLSLHDALPIFVENGEVVPIGSWSWPFSVIENRVTGRSEEHTSELQSRLHLVCRLLLEKKTISGWFRQSATRSLLHRGNKRQGDNVCPQ